MLYFLVISGGVVICLTFRKRLILQIWKPIFSETPNFAGISRARPLNFIFKASVKKGRWFIQHSYQRRSAVCIRCSIKLYKQHRRRYNMSMEMTIQWMILCATVVGVVVGFVKTNGKLVQSIEKLGQIAKDIAQMLSNQTRILERIEGKIK